MPMSVERKLLVDTAKRQVIPQTNVSGNIRASYVVVFMLQKNPSMIPRIEKTSQKTLSKNIAIIAILMVM